MPNTYDVFQSKYTANEIESALDKMVDFTPFHYVRLDWQDGDLPHGNILRNGVIQTYAQVKALYDDPSVFVYLMADDIVSIPSIDTSDVSNPAIAFSASYIVSQEGEIQRVIIDSFSEAKIEYVFVQKHIDSSSDIYVSSSGDSLSVSPNLKSYSVTASSSTSLNNKQVPFLTVQQVLNIYNAYSAYSRHCIVVDKNNAIQSTVVGTDSTNGEISIRVLFEDSMIIKYTIVGDNVSVTASSMITSFVVSEDTIDITIG